MQTLIFKSRERESGGRKRGVYGNSNGANSNKQKQATETNRSCEQKTEKQNTIPYKDSATWILASDADEKNAKTPKKSHAAKEICATDWTECREEPPFHVYLIGSEAVKRKISRHERS